MERNNDPTNELTRPPWFWKWAGSAGCWSLLGQNDITYSGPDTADGRLKAAAPELLATLKLFVTMLGWDGNEKERIEFSIVQQQALDAGANTGSHLVNMARALIAQIEGEAVNVPH